MLVGVADRFVSHVCFEFLVSCKRACHLRAPMRWSPLLLLCLGFTAPVSAAPPAPRPAKPASAPMTAPSGFEAETRAWHAERVARLTAEDGWLTLVGLHWLKEGSHRFGSAPDNDLLFPASVPAHAGTFTRKGD